MKKCSIELITNGNRILYETSPYEIKDDILTLTVQNEPCEYHFKTNTFKKKTFEGMITISYQEKKIFIQIEESNQIFEIPIEEVILQNTEKSVHFTYTFLNPEKTTNCIIIKYH